MSEQNQQTENQFPIRELSARTQVNTVTLRAWERRYGLLKPQRTSKGHRLYSEKDVATIERIVALVARGVPLGKVKPLIQDEQTEQTATIDIDPTENWQILVAQLVSAVETFTSNKVQGLIQELLAQYPASICRERLIEPLFADLAARDDNGAAFGFAESELLRYISHRLDAKISKKNQSTTLNLITGNQAPMWPLALMALELKDAECSVQLLYRPFSVAAAMELARQFDTTYSLFYQDGILKEKEQKLVAAAMESNKRLILCGTAAVLSQSEITDRVFSDIKGCIAGLLECIG